MRSNQLRNAAQFLSHSGWRFRQAILFYSLIDFASLVLLHFPLAAARFSLKCPSLQQDLWTTFYIPSNVSIRNIDWRAEAGARATFIAYLPISFSFAHVSFESIKSTSALLPSQSLNEYLLHRKTERTISLFGFCLFHYDVAANLLSSIKYL